MSPQQAQLILQLSERGMQAIIAEAQAAVQALQALVPQPEQPAPPPAQTEDKAK